jgi:hypothetical protein
MPHGEKFSRLRERAVAALLTHSTIRAAAASIGITERTLQRWQRDPRFVKEWRAARSRLVEHAIGQMQRVAPDAAGVLRQSLKAGRTADRIRAAAAVYDRAIGGEELTDLKERVEALEAAIAATGTTLPPVGVNGSAFR